MYIVTGGVGEAGYENPFRDLEAGARDYVQERLGKSHDNH